MQQGTLPYPVRGGAPCVGIGDVALRFTMRGAPDPYAGLFANGSGLSSLENRTMRLRGWRPPGRKALIRHSDRQEVSSHLRPQPWFKA
jgi:hypothetical protein